MDTNLYSNLLKQYSDSLIELQIDSNNLSFNGGIVCQSCKTIHGRCIDAIYGLSIAYKHFKDDKYLVAAIKLMDYSSNLICTDGAIYNDIQTNWFFTTVFYVIDLAETYLSCKDVLPIDFINRILKSIDLHSKWLYSNLNENSKTNINYPANNVLALYLAGLILKKDEYIKQSSFLADYCMNHITQSNLLCGEGKPHNLTSLRGCKAIDLGYNLEETLPALVKYAYLSDNKEMLDKLYEVSLAHLDFILPDGAIDNSFGCRNYKWTYYGSRTCDGLLPLCYIFGQRDQRFIEMGYRNTKLIESCTNNGLLYGGPMYYVHHEKPCTHQTFEHLNSIAFMVDHLSKEHILNKQIVLPCDSNYFKYYPEFDSYRLANNKYLLDVTCYDVNIPYSGHASGATLSMLYSRENGPLIMGSVGNYELTEPTNMQNPLDRETHRSLLPRFELVDNDELFSSCYYTDTKKGSSLSFRSGLMSKKGNVYPCSEYDIAYQLDEDKLTIIIKNINLDIPFVLPLINGNIKINKGKIISMEKIFFLTPGFIAKEYKILPIEKEIIIEVF